MDYIIKGCFSDNAVRDMLVGFFPDEEHNLAKAVTDNCCCVEIVDSAALVSAVRNGKKTDAKCAFKPENAPILRKRAQNHAVKTALFQALLPYVGKNPPWGSLTGVKPAKPIRLAIEEDGLDLSNADEWLKDTYFVTENRRKLAISAAKYAISAQKEILPEEIQLYIGIPFCPAKCSYCSFVSNDIRSKGHLIEPYLDGLMGEIAAAGEAIKREKLPLGSIYIGGGTPTILNEIQLERLLCAIDMAFDRTICHEYTVEAGRPDTITQGKLSVMARHGVTRISINPQSMDDRVLESVGRHHTAKDIVRAFEQARQEDFDINMDVIAGLPGDSEAGLLNTVKALIALAPENITMHSLSRKKGAALRFGENNRLEAETLDECYSLLAAAGYVPYYLYRQKYIAGGLENVGFCKGETHSYYNICMMEELCSIVALGAGGVTKICSENGRKVERIANPKYPTEYIERKEAVALRKINIHR